MCLLTFSNKPYTMLTMLSNIISDGIMKEDMLMVNFYPKLRETAVTSMGEYIFVIDRSGIEFILSIHADVWLFWLFSLHT